LKKKIYIWCCEKYLDTGEGILANKFINDLKNHNKNLNFIIKFPNKRILLFLRKFLGKITDRIIFPFLGIFYLWCIYFKNNNNKLCYVNYLPLWNFLIFLFLPPNTILGPITGGSSFLKKPILNYILRKFIFNIFYKLSILILSLRHSKLLYSTNLLKDKIKTKKTYYFDYVLKNFKFNKTNLKRKYDLIFYLRNHKNKNTDLQIKLATMLSEKYKIITVGKKINNKKIKNFGKITRIKINNILKQTKFAFTSSENLYSFFSIDCLQNGVYVFYKKDINVEKKIFNNIIPLNYNNYNQLIIDIDKNLRNNYKKPKQIIINFENKFKNYFKV